MSDSVLQLLAVDLGASNGRVHLWRFEKGHFSCAEVRRFEHGPIHVPDDAAGKWSWDLLAIWEQVKRGIALAANKYGRIDGIGIDSWGLDYGLVAADGRLLRPPVAYRDPRTDKTFPQVVERLGRARLYATTGIQFMPINTIYQLAADAADPQRPLDHAATMLMIPQLLAYWLTGRRVAEQTLASTTQLYDARTRGWAFDIADDVGIPRRILPEIVGPEDAVGTLRPDLAAELGLAAGTPVLAVGSHDTASAVVAAPLVDEHSAYLSSGTWSLLGLELPAPCQTDAALAANLTNEAGVAGTTRLLKNVTGLWLVQECRRAWQNAGRVFSHEELVTMAEAAPGGPTIDPNDPTFSAPGDMPRRILDAARRAGASLPDDPAAIIRCVFDSLAVSYASVLKSLCAVTGRTVTRIHIVGGGAQNQLLNRLTAAATECAITAGPFDATSLGNALVQAMALKAVSGLQEARDIVRRVEVEARGYAN